MDQNQTGATRKKRLIRRGRNGPLPGALAEATEMSQWGRIPESVVGRQTPMDQSRTSQRLATQLSGSSLVSPQVGSAQFSGQQVLAPPCGVEHVSNRWRRTEHQAYMYGKVYDSYFATESGWKQFWSPDRSGLVSYRRLGRHVKVIGGLLASDEEKPQLLREFVVFAQSHRLSTTFFNVTEEDAPIFREHGFEVTKWGEEPFVDLQKCNWSGHEFDWVRRQTNYCQRAGITIVEHRRDEMDDVEWALLIQNLRALSDEQLATKAHAGTIRLLEGQLESNRWGRRRLFVAYSSGVPTRIEGFLVALPMRNGRQWSFEMYRHRRDAVRGVVPHLFHIAMMRMKAEGIEAVSLCLVPGLGCEEAITGDSAYSVRKFGRHAAGPHV